MAAFPLIGEHAPRHVEDNFGFPADQVRCSLNSAILSRPFLPDTALIWRRPRLEQVFAHCVHELFARDSDRMDALDGLRLCMKIAPNGAIILSPYLEDEFAAANSGLKIRGASFGLTDILPGSGGKLLAQDIKACARQTAHSFFQNTGDFLILFWTRTKGEENEFHKDTNPVIGINYGWFGTQFGANGSFDLLPGDFLGDEVYCRRDDVPLWCLRPGDVAYIDLPHREHGTRPAGQPKLWVGIFSPSPALL